MGLFHREKPKELLKWVLAKDFVDAGSIAPLEAWIKARSCSRSALEESKSTAVFLFSGYRNDPRECHEIPEVRNWFKKIHDSHPYFPYFLDNEFNDGIKRYMFMLMYEEPRTKSFGKMVQLDVGILRNQAIIIASAIELFCRNHGVHPKQAVVDFLSALGFENEASNLY